MDENRKNAYMTVEAALIYPMIFGGIMFLIYLGMYLYNAATIKQIAYISALRGSLLTETNQKNVKAYISDQIHILSEEKLYLVSSRKEDIYVTNSKER